MFFKGSRYESVATAVHTDSNGRQIPYKLLRVTQDAPSIQIHSVRQADRLDRVAFTYYDDPQQFWRICDANRAMKPDELLDVIGRRLSIAIIQR